MKAPRQSPRRRVSRIALGVWIPLAMIGTWVLVSRHQACSYACVSPSTLGRGFVEVIATGELPSALAGTFEKTLLALCLGAPAGLLVGGALGASRMIDRAIGPLFHAFRQVPFLGLAPLMALWFGTGRLAQVILTVLAVVYPVVLSTYEGIRAIDPKYLEVARVMKLGNDQILAAVTVPAVAPYVYAGVSHAIPFAWIATVGGELLLPSGVGIGTMMATSEAGGRLDLVLVCTLTVAAASLCVDRALVRVGRRMMLWRDDASNRL
ncbi:MAG: ABC transporter permease [Polyangiaceae bacterium]